MLAKAPDALRADMQRFYGLDLDQLGHGIRPRRMADLAAHLPDDAAIWRAIDPRAAWDTTRQLLACIADNTNFLAWAKTKDAARKGAKWKNRIPRPGEHSSTPTRPLPADRMRQLLAMPRGATEQP